MLGELLLIFTLLFSSSFIQSSCTFTWHFTKQCECAISTVLVGHTLGHDWDSCWHRVQTSGLETVDSFWLKLWSYAIRDLAQFCMSSSPAVCKQFLVHWVWQLKTLKTTRGNSNSNVIYLWNQPCKLIFYKTLNGLHWKISPSNWLWGKCEMCCFITCKMGNVI